MIRTIGLTKMAFVFLAIGGFSLVSGSEISTQAIDRFAFINNQPGLLTQLRKYSSSHTQYHDQSRLNEKSPTEYLVGAPDSSLQNSLNESSTGTSLGGGDATWRMETATGAQLDALRAAQKLTASRPGRQKTANASQSVSKLILLNRSKLGRL